MDAPNEFQPLMDEIFRDKVRWAREEKRPAVLSLDAFDMFASGIGWTMAGAYSTRDGMTAEEAAAEVRRRLEIKRKLDEQGFYRTAP